jgi:hypothetical protein
MNHNDITAHVSGFLHCHACLVARPLSSAALAEFIRTGWPTCCGATMTLFTEAEKPTAHVVVEGETPLEGTKVE